MKKRIRRALAEALESRVLLSLAEVQPVARPSYNTGSGFFVRDAKVYDANGYQFDIRGFNHTTWWGNSTQNLAAIAEFPKTKANAVRTVMGTGFGISQTPAQRKSIVEKYIAGGIVPIVEDHMATSGTDGTTLAAVVDRWLQPDNLAWLKQYERQVILNIANEWGPDSTVWRDQYLIAIDRLRGAGVRNLLIIDSGIAGYDAVTGAPGSGQSVHTLETWGKDLIDHDPQHNIVLSVHMYNFWRTEDRAAEVGTIDPAVGSPWDVATELTKMKAAGLPVICGEFSTEAAVKSGVGYQAHRAIEIFDSLDMGWLAWSWNSNSDTMLNMVNGYQYNSDADLTNFGKLIVNDPTLGLNATSVQASIFKSRISGVVYNDADRDGVKDAAELPLAGAVVYLDANKNGSLDANERAVTTGASGAYAFGRLAPDTYTIRVMAPGTFTTTLPAGGVANVAVVASQNQNNVNFGLAAPQLQTPFKGSPFAVSSASATTIQAEDFDNGAEGIAYHDIDAANNGASYRSSAVDVQATGDAGGGYNVGWTKAGEWLEYTIDVINAASYDLALRVASPAAGGKLRLLLDGTTDLTGQLAIPATGAWQTYTTIAKNNVALPAGQHVLRLALDSVGVSGSVGNINWLRLAPHSTGSPVTLTTSTASYVRDGGLSAMNFGNDPTLVVKQWTTNGGYTRESYLQFDLTAVSSIASAKLRLWAALSDSSGSIPIGVYALANPLSPWSESAINWNSRPTTTSTALATSTVRSTTAAWLEMDVTSYLKMEKVAGRNLVTLVLKATKITSNLVAISSDDAAAVTSRPQLLLLT